MTSADSTFELQRRVALYDDEPAYKELFFSFYNPLLRFAATFVHDKEYAEDIVSEVFLKMWQNRKTLTTIENLRVYLYVSIRNAALNFISRQKKRTIVSLENLEMDFPSPTLNPEQLMITAEMMRVIGQAISDLPPRCRLIFKLVKEDGLQYREVAEVLNISIKTIDNQLAIALRKISHTINARLNMKVEY